MDDISESQITSLAFVGPSGLAEAQGNFRALAGVVLPDPFGQIDVFGCQLVRLTGAALAALTDGGSSAPAPFFLNPNSLGGHATRNNGRSAERVF